MGIENMSLENLGVGMGTAIAFLSLYVVTLICVVIIAFKDNTRFLAENPGARPYRWGYFVGYWSAIKTLLFLEILLVAAPSLSVVLYTIALGVIFLLVSYGIVIRKRLAWEVMLLTLLCWVISIPVYFFWYPLLVTNLTLLSAATSFVVFILSTIYFYKRWDELETLGICKKRK